MIENMSHAKLDSLAYIDCLPSSWGYQLVMTGIQYALLMSWLQQWYEDTLKEWQSYGGGVEGTLLRNGGNVAICEDGVKIW
jgi:hypothetical protein